MIKEKSYYSLSKIKKLSLLLANKVKISSFNPDYIIAIARGGLLIGKVVANQLEKELLTIKIQRPSTNNDNISRQNMNKFDEQYLNEMPQVTKSLSKKIESNKKILIVDDKVDTGKTIFLLIKILKKDYNIKTLNIKIAVLSEVNVQSNREIANFKLFNASFVPPWGERANKEQFLEWKSWIKENFPNEI